MYLRHLIPTIPRFIHLHPRPPIPRHLLRPHPLPRIPKHPQPRPILPPLRRMPTVLRRTEHPLRVRHHDSDAAILAGETRDPQR